MNLNYEPMEEKHENQGFIECGRFFDIGKSKFGNFDVVWMQKKIA